MDEQLGAGEHRPPHLATVALADSHQATIHRFDDKRTAEIYSARYGNGWRDRLEVRSVIRAIGNIPPGSHVLDLPCGSGRLLEILLGSGFRVTCADCSEHMVRSARRRWEEIRRDAGEGTVPIVEPSFAVRDVMRTEYPDRHFDAVVCNRLFHHFADSETRIRGLEELRRITKGPVIVSFFNAFSLGSLQFRIKHAVSRLVPHDRMPIAAWTFRNDLRRAGLTPISSSGVLWGISPMWYVVSMPAAIGSSAAHRFDTARSSALRSKAG